MYERDRQSAYTVPIAAFGNSMKGIHDHLPWIAHSIQVGAETGTIMKARDAITPIRGPVATISAVPCRYDTPLGDQTRQRPPHQTVGRPSSQKCLATTYSPGAPRPKYHRR